MTELQHDHHDLTISSMQANLDHENCIEMLFLRGKTKDVQAYADKLFAARGIRHDAMNLVPIDTTPERHSHVHSHGHAHGHAHSHIDFRPKT